MNEIESKAALNFRAAESLYPWYLNQIGNTMIVSHINNDPVIIVGHRLHHFNHLD